MGQSHDESGCQLSHMRLESEPQDCGCGGLLGVHWYAFDPHDARQCCSVLPACVTHRTRLDSHLGHEHHAHIVSVLKIMQAADWPHQPWGHSSSGLLIGMRNDRAVRRHRTNRRFAARCPLGVHTSRHPSRFQLKEKRLDKQNVLSSCCVLKSRLDQKLCVLPACTVHGRREGLNDGVGVVTRQETANPRFLDSFRQEAATEVSCLVGDRGALDGSASQATTAHVCTSSPKLLTSNSASSHVSRPGGGAGAAQQRCAEYGRIMTALRVRGLRDAEAFSGLETWNPSSWNPGWMTPSDLHVSLDVRYVPQEGGRDRGHPRRQHQSEGQERRMGAPPRHLRAQECDSHAARARKAGVMIRQEGAGCRSLSDSPRGGLGVVVPVDSLRGQRCG